MLTYDVFRMLHLLGVVLLIGNVTVTSIWKLYADATRDPVIIAFAQRLVTITDWFFTFWGVLLLVIGGYGAAWVGELDVLRDDWIMWSEVMFAAAGMIWLGVLVPVQIRQARIAKGFAKGGTIPLSYWWLGRIWIGAGLVATVPLIVAMWLMLRKSW